MVYVTRIVWSPMSIFRPTISFLARVLWASTMVWMDSGSVRVKVESR